MKAIVFGAGKIARGFIGQLLYLSKTDITFVDIDQQLVDRLNKDQKYHVYILGDSSLDSDVTGFQAVQLEDEKRIGAALVEADTLIFFNTFCLIGIKRNKIHPCCSGSHNCTFVPKAFIPVMNRIVLQSASFIYCQFHTRFRDFFKAIDFFADISNDIDHQISEMFCFRSDIVKIFRGTGKF